MGFLKRYKEMLTHKHGWEAPLKCSKCGHDGEPEFRGWEPGRSSSGETPGIFAEVFCTDCGTSLKNEAGAKLKELFSKTEIPAANANAVKIFLAVFLLLPLVVAGALFMGVRAGYWNYHIFMIMPGFALLIGPMIMWMNYRIASLRNSCECGAPDYLFMGMLGRSYCFRCANCGRVLRLRD